MKITDPSLPSTLFGPLRFQPLEGSSRRGAGFTLTTGDAPVARLVAPSADESVLVLDEHQDFAARGADAWSLDFVWGAGSIVRTHVLCCAPDVASEPGHLTPELAAWATLMVLWATVPRIPQQG